MGYLAVSSGFLTLIIASFQPNVESHLNLFLTVFPEDFMAQPSSLGLYQSCLTAFKHTLAMIAYIIHRPCLHVSNFCGLWVRSWNRIGGRGMEGS